MASALSNVVVTSGLMLLGTPKTVFLKLPNVMGSPMVFFTKG